MTILTDAVIEKAARADWGHKFSLEMWDEIPEAERECWRRHTRAALEAVLPDIIEACAKVAGEACWKHVGDDAYTQGKDAGAIHQARACCDAIRSLSPKQKD